MEDFTGIETIIQWLEKSGILDIITEIFADYSVLLLDGIINLLFGLLKSSVLFIISSIVSLIIGVIVVIGYIICYILRGIGLMRIAKKLGVDRRFLAWIPFGVDYFVGDCAEKSIARENKKAWNWSLILILTHLACTVGMPIVQVIVAIILSFLPPLSALLNLILSCAGLIFAGLYSYCLYRIFKQFMGNTASIIFTVCSLCLGPLEGVFIFIVSFFKLRPASGNEAAAACVAVIDT